MVLFCVIYNRNILCRWLSCRNAKLKDGLNRTRIWSNLTFVPPNISLKCIFKGQNELIFPHWLFKYELNRKSIQPAANLAFSSIIWDFICFFVYFVRIVNCKLAFESNKRTRWIYFNIVNYTVIASAWKDYFFGF